MSDDETTNQQYYEKIWTKPMKVRIEPKKAKMKSKEITNVLIATVYYLDRMGDRWVYGDHSSRRTLRRTKKG